MECISCSGAYVEDEHQPRNLRCGHVCCRKCLTVALSRSEVVVCPQCRRKQAVDSLDDLPVSQGLLKILQEFQLSKIKESLEELTGRAILISPAQSTLSIHRPSPSWMLQDPLGPAPPMSDGWCDDHGFFRVFYCHTCSHWVCRDCTITEHAAPTCQISSARHGLESMKENIRKELKLEISAFHTKIKALEDITEKMKTNIGIVRDALGKIEGVLEKKKLDLALFAVDMAHAEGNMKQLDETNSVEEVRQLLTDFRKEQAVEEEVEDNAQNEGEVKEKRQGEDGGDERGEATAGGEEMPLMDTCQSCDDAAIALQQLAKELRLFENCQCDASESA